jgi:hypothetical protein
MNKKQQWACFSQAAIPYLFLDNVVDGYRSRYGMDLLRDNDAQRFPKSWDMTLINMRPAYWTECADRTRSLTPLGAAFR